MRINIYSQEIDLEREPEIISKETTGTEGQAITYYGVRLWLRQTEFLHHTPDDDDTSAITIWLPKSRINRAFLSGQLYALAGLMDDLIRKGA